MHYNTKNKVKRLRAGMTAADRAAEEASLKDRVAAFLKNKGALQVPMGEGQNKYVVDNYTYDASDPVTLKGKTSVKDLRSGKANRKIKEYFDNRAEKWKRKHYD